MNRGAFCAVTHDGKILLVRALTHAQYDNHWSFPGGLVDECESYEDGAMREVFEETGVTCKVTSLLTVAHNTFDDIEVHIFRGDYVSGDINVQAEEIAEARWFVIEEAVLLPLAFDYEAILHDMLRADAEA